MHATTGEDICYHGQISFFVYRLQSGSSFLFNYIVNYDDDCKLYVLISYVVSHDIVSQI